MGGKANKNPKERGGRQKAGWRLGKTDAKGKAPHTQPITEYQKWTKGAIGRRPKRREKRTLEHARENGHKPVGRSIVQRKRMEQRVSASRWFGKTHGGKKKQGMVMG